MFCTIRPGKKALCSRLAMRGMVLMLALFGAAPGFPAGSGLADFPGPLERQFLAPPDSARPWVYWFWLDGNITREGITADLEAMRQVGLGGGVLMWGGGVGGGVGIGNVKGPVKLLDPQWWELMRHTVHEADRLGLKINLVNGSGWSHSGGPWVKPEHSMRKLVLSQDFQLDGPGYKELKIAPGDPVVCVSAYSRNGRETDSMIAAGAKVTNQLFDKRSYVDLTGKLDGTGRLGWDVPPGSWGVRVLRHASTGDRPHPIRDDEGGWECDKLSPAAVEENGRGFVLRVLNECGPEARRVIRWTHADSYEFGVQTWTPMMRQEFQRRCGYNLLPFLPALMDATVDNPDTTKRFLWDFARVRADLFAENIGGRFRDLCRKEGVALTTEPHLVPEVFDQIQYGGHVSEPMGNFLGERRTHWYADNPPVGPEVQLAKGEASAAYTYGLNGVVWAEAFTGVDHAHAWKESPDYLRTWGDLWLTEGINQFIFHCWAHSPSLTQKPGITLGPWGIHFDRRNTWFDMASGYLKYLTRCQFLLQQGLPAMDVCFFTGDGVTAEFPRHPELRAAGYDYHGVTADVLCQARAVDGWIVLPSGMRYRLLATYNREMRPRTVRKLQELVRAGASVLGVKPEDAPGLIGYPASGREVRKTGEALWGAGSASEKGMRSVGKGRVYSGEPAKPTLSTAGCGVAAWLDCSREIEVLRNMGVLPDFEYSLSGREDNDHMLAYIHRRIGETDLYFVSNQSGAVRRENCVFRISGRSPELWDAVTGEIRRLPVFSEQNGRTTVPLEFAPGQSFFIVFKKSKDKPPMLPASNFIPAKALSELTGPWQVSFDSKWGGPERAVTFGRLEDWSRRLEDGIRHYSGKAVYRTTFLAPERNKDRRLYLDLGRVKELASVRLNGRELGIVWCAPWRIDIADAIREGSNDLELVVANQWINRLIGDAGKPQEQRFTWTTHNPYKSDSPLIESGLLGPVTLQAEEP